MTTIEIRTPELPESVADAKVLVWHKSAGETVTQDENLADLETDKVVLEVPAPVDGVLEKILAETGAVVNAGAPLATIEPSDGSGAGASEAAESSGASNGADSTGESTPAQESVAVSPAVRRLLEEHDLDISSIKGTGRKGRVLKRDVLAVLSSASGVATAARVEEPETAGVDEGESVEAPAGAPQTARQERRETMSRLRARIAQRMVESQREAAMLTTFTMWT